jgi:hypothetical protein
LTYFFYTKNPNIRIFSYKIPFKITISVHIFKNAFEWKVSYILWSIGIVCGLLVQFYPFRYVVSRKKFSNTTYFELTSAI